ncbi:hypothetical protein [Ekhidna sp.]|uniref:hypothetical protein n=1 Tax=Ekhidna sp. TaxID=2608089 RepID=UPI003CCBF000
MKKNTVIGILILLVLFAMTYAKIKANEVEEQASQAAALRTQVEQLTSQAEQLKQAAEEAAAEALMQRARAEEALRECESTK